MSYKNQFISSIVPKKIPLRMKPKHLCGKLIPYNKARVLPQEPPKIYQLSIFRKTLSLSMSEIRDSVLLFLVSAY